jgi:hypothetical protein
MGRACGMYGAEEETIPCFGGQLKARDFFQVLDIKETIILKCALREQNLWCRADPCGSGYGQVAASCEHGNKLSGSTKRG